jgi:hypothetical protein
MSKKADVVKQIKADFGDHAVVTTVLFSSERETFVEVVKNDDPFYLHGFLNDGAPFGRRWVFDEYEHDSFSSLNELAKHCGVY